eukprot:m.104629 g.104629  ORF g.104629 m.104629 type:complete len:132 (+) comp15086_c0_seq1:26-421(+)
MLSEANIPQQRSLFVFLVIFFSFSFVAIMPKSFHFSHVNTLLPYQADFLFSDEFLSCAFFPPPFQCEHITSARRGLVPGNFIAPVSEKELEELESHVEPAPSTSSVAQSHTSASTSSSKKKGFFKVFGKRS